MLVRVVKNPTKMPAGFGQPSGELLPTEMPPPSYYQRQGSYGKKVLSDKQIEAFQEWRKFRAEHPGIPVKKLSEMYQKMKGSGITKVKGRKLRVTGLPRKRKGVEPVSIDLKEGKYRYLVLNPKKNPGFEYLKYSTETFIKPGENNGWAYLGGLLVGFSSNVIIGKAINNIEITGKDYIRSIAQVGVSTIWYVTHRLTQDKPMLNAFARAGFISSAVIAVIGVGMNIFRYVRELNLLHKSVDVITQMKADSMKGLYKESGVTDYFMTRPMGSTDEVSIIPLKGIGTIGLALIGDATGVGEYVHDARIASEDDEDYHGNQS